MIDHTELELRLAAHEARVGRANRDGWMRQSSAPIGDNRAQGMRIVAPAARRQLGMTIMRIGRRIARSGERLCGTTFAANIDSAHESTTSRIR